MVQIISDTSTLYSVREGKEKNIEIVPLQVTIQSKTYVEFEEIQSKELIDLINQGGIPSSSQPTIGRVLEAYEKHKDQPILNITMADGLSGTYQSAYMAKNQSEGDITVLNSKTLCGPHRYLVNKAVKLAENGKSVEEIVDILTPSIQNSVSFLIPQDFEFLRRGGRCSKVAASLGGLLKLVIVMKQSDDGKQLDKHVLARTYRKALASICDTFHEKGVDEDYVISISHATNQEQVNDTYQFIHQSFPNTEIEIFDLSPVFITQGGPGCLAIQAIKK